MRSLASGLPGLFGGVSEAVKLHLVGHMKLLERPHGPGWGPVLSDSDIATLARNLHLSEPYGPQHGSPL